MPRAGIEPATRGFSVLCSTDWAIWAFNVQIAGAGFEPTTFGLWARRATRLLHPAILFKWWEKDSNLRRRCQQIYSLPPLATRESHHNHIYKTSFFTSIRRKFQMWKPLTGLEPVTCWLQISCSANWATTAHILLLKKMGPTGLEPVTLCL